MKKPTVRDWVEQALTEIKLAREYLSRQYAGPENDALEWAQQFLENALAGKGGDVVKTEKAIEGMTRAEREAYRATVVAQRAASNKAWRNADPDKQRRYNRERKLVADAARGKR